MHLGFGRLTSSLLPKGMNLVDNFIEFSAKISNGKIDVPPQYREALGLDVKVILMKTVKPKNEKNETEKIAKGFGALAHRANPALWDQEEGAWGRAVRKKYGLD